MTWVFNTDKVKGTHSGIQDSNVDGDKRQTCVSRNLMYESCCKPFNKAENKKNQPNDEEQKAPQPEIYIGESSRHSLKEPESTSRALETLTSSRTS